MEIVNKLNNKPFSFHLEFVARDKNPPQWLLIYVYIVIYIIPVPPYIFTEVRLSVTCILYIPGYHLHNREACQSLNTEDRQFKTLFGSLINTYITVCIGFDNLYIKCPCPLQVLYCFPRRSFKNGIRILQSLCLWKSSTPLWQ